MELIKKTCSTRDSKNRPWRMGLFRCDKCGSITEKRLQNGKRDKSCGCENKTEFHGHSNTPLYKCWVGMIQRCTNPKNPRYFNWGGRGISVCNEWLESPSVFFNWALSNGYKEGLEIDRRDNDGNYKPSNCRFVTHAQNNQNKRGTKLKHPYPAMIRGLYSSGNISQRRLGELFGVGHCLIGRVVRNLSWT